MKSGLYRPLDFDHPDLRDNADEEGNKTLVPGTSDAWDQNGHGTHVAGAIAANGKMLDLTVTSTSALGKQAFTMR
ncbi:S8 family serine peptidase [Brevibacillus borstelensis]|uniref:S8 family serine peptidase n=1 Tax=Brevibacillus borstelensis TaxID=45462 RepID=UPI0030C230EB